MMTGYQHLLEIGMVTMKLSMILIIISEYVVSGGILEMTRSVRKPIPKWAREFCLDNMNTVEGRVIFKIYDYLLKNVITLSYYLKQIGMYSDASTCLRRMKLGKLPNIITLSKMIDIFTREELCWLVHYWHDEYYGKTDMNSGKLIEEFVNTDFLDFEYVDIPELFHGCRSISGDKVTQSITERQIRKNMDRLIYMARSFEIGFEDYEEEY